jgi:hypothetical protein
MPIFATAGAALYIGSAITVTGVDLQASDFTSQTWTVIKHPESLGSAGDSAQEIAFDDILSRRTRRFKGQRSAGGMDLVFGLDYADAGQLALVAAEKTDSNYAFRLVFNDAPTDGTPSERLFAAMVGSIGEQLDAANNVVKLNASLWINSNIVRVAAAAGS